MCMSCIIIKGCWVDHYPRPLLKSIGEEEQTGETDGVGAGDVLSMFTRLDNVSVFR